MPGMTWKFWMLIAALMLWFAPCKAAGQGYDLKGYKCLVGQNMTSAGLDCSVEFKNKNSVLSATGNSTPRAFVFYDRKLFERHMFKHGSLAANFAPGAGFFIRAPWVGFIASSTLMVDSASRTFIQLKSWPVVTGDVDILSPAVDQGRNPGPQATTWTLNVNWRNLNLDATYQWFLIYPWRLGIGPSVQIPLDEGRHYFFLVGGTWVMSTRSSDPLDHRALFSIGWKYDRAGKSGKTSTARR